MTTTPATTERIQDNPVADELRDSFLEYSMSVIVARALPDVRDGLKPVHRRILWSMYDQLLRPDKAHTKCARVVGDVMGKWHPHGDGAIYEALVRMSQDFALRLPLVDGHGNFGSLDDGPAASRYTECRLTVAALDLIGEVSEGTVDFRKNYDGKLDEPSVLPAAFPNLIVNGTTGIAVGMATNMAPHNLREVVAGLRAMLDNPDLTLDELLTHIPGPDLPTGADIIAGDGLREAYETGRGAFRMRAAVSIEDVTPRKKGIVVTALPYTVGPEKVIAKIKELVGLKKLNGVSAVVDYSDRRHGLRLVIEVKTGFNAAAVLAELFKATPLEESFSVNAVCLVDGQPRTLGLLELCRYYLDHRIDVVRRRTRHRLDRAEARLHLVDGLLVALDAIDEVVAIIRSSRDTETARKKLTKSLKLSDIQIVHILDMPLRRLTGLEVTKLRAERKELETTVAALSKILGSNKVLNDLVADELAATAETLGDDRRSTLLDVETATATVASVPLQVADDPCTVVLTTTGLVGRQVPEEKLPRLTASDVVASRIETTNHSPIVAITSQGRALRISAMELPVVTGTARGGPAGEFFTLDADERVVGLVAASGDTGFVVVTRNGTIKRVLYANAYPKTDGAEVIGLEGDDVVIAAIEVDGTEDAVIVASDSQVLRTPLEKVRPQGRLGGGVAGMRLSDGATVLAAGIGGPDTHIATCTDAGTWKVSGLDEYPPKGRATGGVRGMRFLKGETAVAAAWVGEGFPVLVNDSAVVTVDAQTAKRDASGAEGPVTAFGSRR